LQTPYGIKRTLRVNVAQKLRENLTLECTWVNRHVQHVFDIPWAILIDANRATLENFFVSCRGRYTNDIAYTDPWDSVGYTCRFDMDELILQWLAHSKRLWSGSIRLIEISGFKAKKASVSDFPATIPVQTLSHDRRFLTVISATPADLETRYEDYANAAGIRRWPVGGDVLNDAQALALLNCWEGNGGPWANFSFTESDSGTVYDSHFAETELVHTLITSGAAGRISSIHATVEELKAA